MAGVFPGYEYDIFISYRQNDNKYDGWVTEFVSNLNKELEATIKDKVTVYFDANPHDGLLETHSVNQSLERKLKCLIFIPILSKTYCDQRSFAWNNEFLAFLKIAGSDPLGHDIRLPGGNVAGRVLPVRIHDLAPEDIRLVEDQIGHIRSVDFIYKSAGVNRPLRANEDHPHDNQNKTYYRDQINKVANAIDEIIGGIKNAGKDQPKQPDALSQRESTGIEPQPEVIPGKQKSKGKSRVFSIGSIGIVLIVLFFFFFSSGSTLPFTKRDWVLITDFENMTGDPLFDKSLYTAFSLTISQSRYINVFPRSRTMETLRRMKLNDGTAVDDKTGREIAVREGIDIYIVPNISSVGDKYILTARILETKTGNILKSHVVNAGSKDDILESLDELSRAIRRNLGESRYGIAKQDKPLVKVTTSSIEALKQYSMGIESNWKLDYKNARSYYENALRLDSGFTAAKASLGNILLEVFNDRSGEELLRQAIRSIDNLTDKEKYGILAFYNVRVEKNLAGGIENSRILTGLYPDDPTYHNNLGYYLQLDGQLDEALKEYKAAVVIDPTKVMTYGGIVNLYLSKLGKVDSAKIWARKMIRDNPRNAWGYLNLGSGLVCSDSLEGSVEAFLRARDLSPTLTLNLYRLAYSYRLMGLYRESTRVLENISQIDRNDIAVNYELGLNFLLSGDSVKARDYFSSFRQNAGEAWLKKYPDMAKTYITLGAAEARLYNLDESRQLYRKAMSMDSTLYIDYAELMCSQGDLKAAVVKLSTALETGYRDIYWLKVAPDLIALQKDPEFRELMIRYFK